jgi:hypothetical protein
MTKACKACEKIVDNKLGGKSAFEAIADMIDRIKILENKKQVRVKWQRI